MAQRWVDITTINNNTPFSAVRWVGQFTYASYMDMWFSEEPGLVTDGMDWSDGNAQYGWYGAHRMNGSQFTCDFSDTTIDPGGPYEYGVSLKDAERNQNYDTTVEIGGVTFYEVDFSTWTNYKPLYAPFSSITDYWVAGQLYVYAGTGDISVEPDEVAFRSGGGSSSVTVTAANDWSASTNDAWITVSDLSGVTGTTAITVSVGTYSGASARTGVVTFSCNTDTFDLTITQNPPQIDLDKTKLKFKSTGGTDVIEITSDLDWTASTVDNWLTLSQSSGTSGTTSVTVTAAAFIGGSSARTDVITFTDGTNTKTVNVKQNYKLGVDGMYLGVEALEGLYLGSDEVEAVYLGQLQIF